MTCFASTGRRRSRSKVRSDARGAGLRFLNAGDAHQSCVDVTLRLDQSGALLGGWIPMVAADDRRGGSAPGGPHADDPPAWEDSATAGAVVRRVHGGDPSRTRLFLSSLLQSIFSTARNAGVGRLCDGGRRRQARSWGGPITNPAFPFQPSSVHFLRTDDTQAWEDSATAGAVVRRVHGGDPSRTRLFLSSLLQSIFSTGRHAGVGRLSDGGRHRQARSWGGPITNPAFPFQPSSVHFPERSKRRRGKTLRRRAPSSGAFMGGPSRTRLFLSGLLQSIFPNGRNAGVGRLCDGGRHRQARSWGDPSRTRLSPSDLLQSIQPTLSGPTGPAGVNHLMRPLNGLHGRAAPQRTGMQEWADDAVGADPPHCAQATPARRA